MFIKSVLAAAALIISTISPMVKVPVQSYTPASNASVYYTTHVQNIGWQDWKSNGEMAGTEGKSYRLEGIKIEVNSSQWSGGVTYSTHVQNIGWQDYVSDGAMAGTSGKSYRLEAIQIWLHGELMFHYDIYYRVHCQNIGWMAWAKNGDITGSEGYGYRLEAIEIVLVDKNSTGPYDWDANDISYVRKAKSDDLSYSTHVQNIGWQDPVNNGEVSGTSGKSYRLEGIKIDLGKHFDSSISYRTHVQNIGWQDWVSDGALSGTSGKSLRLEAIEIELGDDRDFYDIYYRVHCQNIGWMGWAKNGESAGTAGYGYRLEAIQIMLCSKIETPKDYDPEVYAFVDCNDFPKATINVYDGNTNIYGEEPSIIGNPGSGVSLTNICSYYSVTNPYYYLETRVHQSGIGWSEWLDEGDYAPDDARIEAVQFRTWGDASKYFTVYYRVYVTGSGWTGWKKNGETAGTTGQSKGIEAVQVVTLKKGVLPY